MMKNFSYFCLGLLISVGLFFAPYASAQTYLTFDTKGNIVGHFSQAQVNVLQQQTGVNWATAGTVDQRIPGAPAGAAGRVSVPVTVNRAVSNAAIAKAAGKKVVSAIPLVGAALTIKELVDMLGDKYTVEEGVAKKLDQPGIEGDEPGTGYAYMGISETASRTPQAACDKLADVWWANNPQQHANWQQSKPTSVSPAGLCSVVIVSNDGNHVSWVYTQVQVSRIMLFYIPGYSPVTESQAETDFNIRFQNGVSSRDAFEALRRGEEANPGAWPADFNPVSSTTPVTVDAPAVQTQPVVTSTGTRTNPDGSVDTTTTTKQTTVTPTTTGTTVGDSKTTFPSTTTTTTTTTNNTTNNTTTSTNTTINEESEDDQDYSFVDPTMPPLPKLYEQKYPDGIAGVWRDNKPNLTGTQFWQGITSMFPSIGGGGSCPNWAMTFNIMTGANFGSVPFDVPCWIWQAIGLILLTTSAFAARKIII